MKATLSVVILAIFVGCILFAPAASAAPVFGVKAGVNLANIKEDPEFPGASYNIRPGLAIGGNIEFALTSSNKVTIRGDVMYVMKGTKITEEDASTNTNLETTIKVDELVVAPFLVFRFPSGGVTPFLQAGPEVGFNVTHKYNVKGTAFGENVDESGDIEDWASTNFGINLGGGIAIPAGKGEVVFDARYNLGLTNMYTGDFDGTIKTNGIQLLAGYNFSVLTI